ncbi:MAG TPA: response regulator transcription factor [Candidatus Acidoferrales bacterium]|jgi:DNA-binding NarL/FixJ family response regulator|nr:response regulator transcription factor [Candidatus Acidoferrales bacterium]
MNGKTGGDIRVLVCENDPVMRSAISDLIRAVPGLDLVGAAADVDTAIQQASVTAPDAVVIDVRMPGGGGSRAARVIRRTLPGSRLIAYSAHADRDAVLEMLRAGANEYLIKGVDDDVLVEAIGRTGRGHIGLPPIQLEELLLDMADLLATAEARLEATQAEPVG